MPNGTNRRLAPAPMAERQLETQRLDAQAHTAALEAFVAFTEVSDSEFDMRVLAQQAIRMLHAHFPEAHVAYFERGDSGWTPVAWSGDVRPDDLALTAGHASGVVMKTLSQAQVDTIHDLRAQPSGPFPTPPGLLSQFPPGHYPLIIEGQALDLLTLELEENTPSTAFAWSVFRAVGRSLTLALERAQSVKQLAQHARDLEESTVKLKNANEELEAFSYSVSHDLRTPLRHIKGFSQLLRGSLGDAPGEKVTRYLGVIDDAVGRMNTLIDGMMDLSITSRLPLRKGLVSLDGLLTQARIQAELEGAYSQVRWTVGPLPTVTGDPDALRLVLIHLLSNALKFSHGQKQPHVEVWAKERLQE